MTNTLPEGTAAAAVRRTDERPVIHSADALSLVGAPADEPDLAPAHERALGSWALETHGSDFIAVEGYPMRTAGRRTAGSRSGWSASWLAWSGPRTSARSRPARAARIGCRLSPRRMPRHLGAGGGWGGVIVVGAAVPTRVG